MSHMFPAGDECVKNVTLVLQMSNIFKGTWTFFNVCVGELGVSSKLNTVSDFSTKIQPVC